MEHFAIKASPREIGTKGSLRQNRIAGKIPAVVYGSGKEARAIFVDEKDVTRVLASITESTILDLQLDDGTIQAFVKDRQRDSMNFNLIHLDFLEVVKGKTLHARVHIQLEGSPAGVRDGGVLENPGHEIEVECDPSVLPEKIVVDVSGLQVNGVIHVRDLSIPEGVKVLSSSELVIAMVKYARGEAVPEAAEAAPVAAAAPAAAAEPEKK